MSGSILDISSKSFRPIRAFPDNSTNILIITTFLLTDSTSKDVTWFVANIAAFDGQLEIHKRTKSAVAYQSPASTDSPVGMHVMILALFEQNETWSQKDLARVSMGDFNFGEWLEQNSRIIQSKPLAATFYGYSTRRDDRKTI
uniref:Uncharacterized protein n=1 Tax=Caenorhabditis japonica TaxID=281687 RepID=A0A8R1EMX8_CAEJA